MSGVKRDCQCPRARHEHGTWGAYCNDDCRCQLCRDAWAAYTRERRRRVAYAAHTRWPLYVQPHGTARRLQALATLGWAPKELAPMLGTAECVVADWRRMQTSWIYGRNAAKVAAMYDGLWNVPSPGRYARKVQRLAEREGWLPPLAWDDDTIDDPAATPEVIHAVRNIENPPIKNFGKNGGRPANPGPDAEILDEIAIEEAIAGRPVRLTKAEASVAQARLAAMGYTHRQIAERLRITKRTVERRGRAA